MAVILTVARVSGALAVLLGVAGVALSFLAPPTSWLAVGLFALDIVCGAFVMTLLAR